VEHGTFVGREPELAVLGRGLAEACDGGGCVVLVEGEAGMGKTVLAHELTQRARQEGLITCWGGCLEAEGAPPYFPWTQILRALGVSTDMLLAPDEDSRFRRFYEVVEVLRTASGKRGMLLVLDDLHWADVPSMRLLQLVASQLTGFRLLIVGLYRSTEFRPGGELTQVLSALQRDRATSRLTMSGLATREIEELATHVLRRRPDDAFLRAVEQRTEGNPLFVVELVRLAASSGAGQGWLPAGVREVIARRFDRMPEATRHVLRQASVLGRDFSLGLVAQLADAPPSDIALSLEDAIAADLVTPGEGHSLRFAHSLMQEVAYGELSQVERQHLHKRAADAIGEADQLLDVRAHHLRQAAPLIGAAPALDATLLAARRATAQLAYEHAAFQYGQALGLLDLLPDATVTRQELLLDLARCQFRSGAVTDSWASCRNAADLARAAGDAVTVAEAATVIRGLANDPICDEIHMLCREALTLLGGADPVLEARLLGQLAVTASQWAGGAEPGLTQRALVAAESTGDPDALFLALQARHTELVDARYALERLALGERAVQLGRDTGRDDYAFWGHVWRLDTFWELSRRVQMDTELAALTSVVGHLKEPLGRWRLTMVQASMAMMEGRYTDARTLADQALTIGRKGGHGEAEFMHVVFRDHLASQVSDEDDLSEVEVFVRRFAEEGPFFARAWHAHVLASLGRLDEASAVWASVLPHLDEFPRYTPEWIINLTASTDMCLLLDQKQLAPTLYADMLPFADRQATGGAHTPSRGPVALYLGKLARELENWEPADAHLASALHLATAMGARPHEAMTRVEMARLLLARRRTGDIARAEVLLEEAIRTARRLGMKSLESEASSLLAARRGGRSTPLSPREEEVAALVAKGLSNRQVASSLHLSERTVETHVRSIFNKLGVESRAGIASWFTARQQQH
jgi:ATP/maltotriose-dependent transcriptional regulator MalT